MEKLRPSQTEPAQEELEALATDEERSTLRIPDVPDEVKSEISERLDRFDQDDAARTQAEDARNES